MYKPSDRSQSSFLDFNQPMGLQMNPNNRWVKMADSVPWDVFEKKYSRLFKAKTGNVAKPVRMALGALIIQTIAVFHGKQHGTVLQHHDSLAHHGVLEPR